MEISLQLLNKYVKVDDVDAKELADYITSIGLEVEGVAPLARGTKLVVGYVKERKDHPDSDHLNVCQVQTSEDTVTQIVCGAPNVDAGQKVIVALPGCDLGNGFVIKNGVIRGEESNGMICSLAEIGIDGRFLTEAQKDGIEVLPSDAPIGHEALSYLGFQDTILDIGLTPNRADCMAYTSLAYEVGAILGRPVTLPEIKPMEELDSDIVVKTESSKCSFFGAKLVKGVETKESPNWLKTMLIANGIKPVNNIVDISNFIMLETGQPLHMYDYDKLVKKEFVVKRGFDCKKALLDSEEYKVEPTDLIVSVNNDIACVAGVYGSEDTKIDDNTTNIVIEAATFDGATIRSTARRLNLLTDASQHFIKGAYDVSKSLEVLDRTANLLQELAGAKEIYKTVDTGLEIQQRVVSLTTSRVNGLLGTSITTEQISEIFTKLCFTFTQNNNEFQVTVPTYRKDITMDADLIEEVARMYGYDNIPSTLPEMSMTQGSYSVVQQKENMIKDMLISAGLYETLTYTLTSPSMVNDFALFHDTDVTIGLMSPLGEERSVTRKSLIPSLLQVLNYNASHARKDMGVFEISNNYGDVEVQTLAIACQGMYNALPWQQKSQKYDFYVVKGFVDMLLKKLSIDESRYTFKRVESDNEFFHPGRSGYLYMGKNIVGVIGQVHPSLEKKYGVKETYIAELNLSVLLPLQTRALKFETIPMYPSVSRDIALVMDQDISTYDVLRTIHKASKRLVKDTTIFDVYVGDKIDEGKKSVAIALTFQDPSKTLDDTTITATMDLILAAVEKEHKAVLRS